MIAKLQGTVSEKLDNRVIIDVRGIGYGIFVTNEDYSQLVIDELVSIFIYEYIREQAHDMFGFLSRDTQNLFEQLLDVNGVGPKMALNVLSVSKTSNVRTAIANGDVAFIQQANGVGKKVAERIIVDLKDKVGLVGVDINATGLLHNSASLAKDDATEALIALGFTANDASQALRAIDPELPTAERIKQALQGAVL